jgi:hypothetical protein
MSNWRRGGSLVVAGIVAIVGALSFTPAAMAAAGPFQIKNFGSGLCIQTDPANSGADIQIVQEPCDTTRTNRAQLWFFDSIGGSDYHIVNVGTLNCMRALANTDAAQVQTIDCTNISDSRWSVSGPLPTTVPHQIISRVGGGSRCLDVAGGSKATGGKIQIFHCTTDNAAQVYSMA